MDWQLFFTWFAIALAGGYVLVRSWRSWRGSKGGCGGGCGCPTKPAKTQPALIKPEQLVLRQRPKPIA